MKTLADRYPHLGFLLSFFPSRSVKLTQKLKPFSKWLSNLTLDEIEILFVGGLPGFELPETLFTWLKKQKNRALVFLEDELGAFREFDQPELINHPQIHFHFIEGDPYEDLASAYPSDRVSLYLLKKMPLEAEKLLRSCAQISALFSDVLYSHFLVENVLCNYQRLPGCFAANQWKGAFEGIPAIICGAGPSLNLSLEHLKTHRDKALIFGCGSAITALSKASVLPHLSIALDPNPEEFQRLMQSTLFEGPFLFAPRLHHAVFATTNGPFGFLKTDTGGLLENWLETECGLLDPPIGPDLGPEAFSVTTLAVGYATALGCNPIILDGVDLAYTSGNRYAPGIDAEAEPLEDFRALEKPLVRSDVHGKPVKTLLKWVMESDAIAQFAKAHPETTFLNATQGGLGFDGVKQVNLEEELAKYLSLDLDGLVHQHIQAAPIHLKQKIVADLIETLKGSLASCQMLCEKILDVGDAKKALYVSDFEQEPAYEALLSGIDHALDRLLPRYYPFLDPEEGKPVWEKAKYQEMLSQIERFSAILHKERAYCATSEC